MAGLKGPVGRAMANKVLVETTGPFQLLSMATFQGIQAHRPSVIVMEPFFQARLGIGQVRVLCNNLKTEATDKEFAEFWKEAKGDKALAVQSFLAKYDADYAGPKEVEEPAKKPGAKAKPE